MNKRKLLSISLGILLVAGGTFLGTKSYLKDIKPVKNDLVITTGTLELSVYDESEWSVLDKSGTEIKNVQDGNKFKNVRPGDSFKKTIKLENSGSLSQRIKVNKPFSINKHHDIFSINDQEINDLNGKIIAPGKIKEVSITVSTNPDAMTDKSHQNLTLDFNEIINPAEIEANQVNLPK